MCLFLYLFVDFYVILWSIAWNISSVFSQLHTIRESLFFSVIDVLFFSYYRWRKRKKTETSRKQPGKIYITIAVLFNNFVSLTSSL